MEEEKKEVIEKKEEQQEPPKEKPQEKAPKVTKAKGELTPKQVQQRKKLFVYPILVFVFAGCMYLIFAPSSKEENQNVGGYNAELPMPGEEGMADDKIKAYEQAQSAVAKSDRMKTLQDFMLDHTKGVETKEDITLPNDKEMAKTDVRSSVASSTEAYRKMNSELNGFYQEKEPEDDQKSLELEWRIQELERKLETAQTEKSATEDQLQLMEKSYQMAAKYMGEPPEQPSGTEDGGQVAQTTSTSTQKKPIGTKVTMIKEQTVSGLSQPVSDSAFVVEYSKPRNLEFNTAVGSGYVMTKNTIKACVHGDQSLMDGQTVRLRLLEPMQAGEIVVPKNSLVSGTAKVQGERLDIEITSVEYAGNIIPVELAVHDTDGSKGIYVPSSMEREALNEAMANIGAGLGSSFSFAQSSGQQITMDVTRGLMQGASGYLGKKFRTVKVMLKAGYQVMLYSKEK